MPDTRRRRGPHPKDFACFGADNLPTLRRAMEELSWLLGRGYSPKASLKLVGDRYALRDRQRKALQRCAASDEECRLRAEKVVRVDELAGETAIIDGYNVILTLEAALSGGVLLLARDGVLRDLASLSAHYRRLSVTRPAVELLVRALVEQKVAGVECVLDRPISNSARLKKLIEEIARSHGPSWEVRLSAQTDRELKRSPHIVATADSAILDVCDRWVNLARWLVEDRLPSAWMIDLRLADRAS
ncbi:MAG: DUF434 domain-containing protein [bacterium]|nr:DUF434 domain-containing protein [bacterium]